MSKEKELSRINIVAGFIVYALIFNGLAALVLSIVCGAAGLAVPSGTSLITLVVSIPASYFFTRWRIQRRKTQTGRRTWGDKLIDSAPLVVLGAFVVYVVVIKLLIRLLH